MARVRCCRGDLLQLKILTLTYYIINYVRASIYQSLLPPAYSVPLSRHHKLKAWVHSIVVIKFIYGMK